MRAPEEWGPIPERCESWPWSECPDCHGRPGELHSPMCGALDGPGTVPSSRDNASPPPATPGNTPTRQTAVTNKSGDVGGGEQP